MNSDELKTKFTTAYKIIMSERKMREYVFRDDPLKQSKKLQEIDTLLTILVEMKDALKEHCLEQPRLLDVPRKAEYQ
jgi:hypothetical protein